MSRNEGEVGQHEEEEEMLEKKRAEQEKHRLQARTLIEP
jgi:hypothetical protein